MGEERFRRLMLLLHLQVKLVTAHHRRPLLGCIYQSTPPNYQSVVSINNKERKQARRMQRREALPVMPTAEPRLKNDQRPVIDGNV